MFITSPKIPERFIQFRTFQSLNVTVTDSTPFCTSYESTFLTIIFLIARFPSFYAKSHTSGTFSSPALYLA